jgi:hypothetical protein
MNRGSFFAGIALIVFGLLLLAENLGYLDLNWSIYFKYVWRLWPLLLIVGGLAFWGNWLKNREDISQLLPGTILLVYGGLFLYLSLSNEWGMMREYNLWALFIAGPGLGYLAMYIFGSREKGHLTTAGILLLISAVFLAGVRNWNLLWPIILILIGLRLLLKSRHNNAASLEKTE